MRQTRGQEALLIEMSEGASHVWVSVYRGSAVPSITLAASAFLLPLSLLLHCSLCNFRISSASAQLHPEQYRCSEIPLSLCHHKIWTHTKRRRASRAFLSPILTTPTLHHPGAIISTDQWTAQLVTYTRRAAAIPTSFRRSHASPSLIRRRDPPYNPIAVACQHQDRLFLSAT